MPLETEQADGSDTANLKFESYEITKGKYSLKGLPAMFAKEDEAETLEIVLTDRVSGLKAHLLYGVFPHLDAVSYTHLILFLHRGESSPEVPDLQTRVHHQYIC